MAPGQETYDPHAHSCPAPGTCRTRKVLPSLGLSFPPIKWGEASTQAGLRCSGQEVGEEAQGGPLSPGPGLPAQAAPFHTPTCRGQVDGAPVPHQPLGPGLQFPAQFVGCHWISAWGAGNRRDFRSASLPFLCGAGMAGSLSASSLPPHSSLCPFLLWSGVQRGLPLCAFISLSPGLQHRLPGGFSVSLPSLR
uniref:Uncharacterized protein n=1 Tax=Molossus molossus TaxID=27622 RepID=A0A7J8HBK1_MOLMO|nr:hypothetical protein HJG59_011110 [Molossus molossus]